MSEPDIIRPIGNGMFALVYINAIEVPRQGDDTWRIQIPVLASQCLADGTLVKDGDGNEMPAKSPLPSINAPYAAYAHHPEVAALFQAIRDVSIKIVTGELAPAVSNAD